MKKALFVVIIAFIAYSLNLPIDYKKTLETRTFRRLLTSYDVTAATFLPYEILEKGTISFSQETLEGMERAEAAGVHSVMTVNNKNVSAYPTLSGFMAIPIYAIPVLLNKIPALHYVEDLTKVLILGRLSASFFTAISVGIFFLILKEIDKYKKPENSNWTYIVTFFYAFGTNLYATASRALWQHTSSLLFISLAILFLFKSLSNKKNVKWLGVFTALMYIARPLNIIFVAIISAYVFIKHRSEFIKYLTFAFPFFVMHLAYNYYILGDFFTSEYVVKNDTAFSTPLLEGLIGNLFSPARSFLFISPPLLLGLYEMLKNTRKHNELNPILKMLSLTFAIIFVLYSKWWCWYGADRFGYGFFTEWIPIVGVFTYLFRFPKKKFFTSVIAILIAWSVYAQFNAVWFRKSRCTGEHNWDFSCLEPAFLEKHEY